MSTVEAVLGSEIVLEKLSDSINVVVNLTPEAQTRAAHARFSVTFDHRNTHGKAVCAELLQDELRVMEAYRAAHGLKPKEHWAVHEIPESSGTDKQTLYSFREKVIASKIADTEEKKSFCSDITLLRYLRARGLNMDKAHTMLSNSLKWRGVKLPYMAANPATETDSELTDVRIIGMDNKHRPVIFQSYVGSKDHSPASLELNNVCVMEKAMQCMSAYQQHNVIFVYDLGAHQPGGLSGLKEQLKMVGAVKNIAKVFQDHYPELLAKMVFINPPVAYEAAFKAAKPFIDPKTAEKLLVLHRHDLLDKITPVVGEEMAVQIFDLHQH